MTNEEKATQIASNICGFTPSDEKLDITGEWGCAEDAALEMAEWKDKQFAKYLEERRLDIADTNCFSFEGILEFIEETEQLLKEGRLFEFRRFSSY